MIIKRNVILGLIFLSIFSAIPLRAEEIQSPKEDSGAISTPSSSEPVRHEEGGRHEDMHKDKEHEGMHGMMMGHSKGWMIVIGAVMVFMMAAMVL